MKTVIQLKQQLMNTVDESQHQMLSSASQLHRDVKCSARPALISNAEGHDVPSPHVLSLPSAGTPLMYSKRVIHLPEFTSRSVWKSSSRYRFLAQLVQHNISTIAQMALRLFFGFRFNLMWVTAFSTQNKRNFCPVQSRAEELHQQFPCWHTNY